MFPWASVIGLAGQALAGVMSANANKKAEEKMDKEFARQKAFYESQMYQDPLNRSENQALLGTLKRQLDKQTDRANAVSKITGATPEMQLAMHQNNADAYGNAIGSIYAGESARRDKLNNQINEAMEKKASAEIELLNNKQNNYANLAANAANAFAGIMGGYSAPSAGNGGANAQMNMGKTVFDDPIYSA